MFPARRWLVSCSLLAVLASAVARSFTIDYEHDTFLKDGQPIQIVSGSIHYFRVHPTDWADRLYKLRYAGFNTVQTYIEWSSHEPQPGQFDMSGPNNLTGYLDTAQQQGLLVILRPGPFIDAERDMGGLPYWLLQQDPKISLRSMDPTYTAAVETWYKYLLSKVKPYLYSEGGPVIMVQVENEYGSYGACDYEYTGWLRDLLLQELGQEVLLHTTDGDATSYLKCGKVPYVYATVDFGAGTDVTKAFHSQRVFEPKGPSMNSEFYPGWLDHWGEPHSTVSTEAVTGTLDEMLSKNASVNMYLVHGGTSFGLTAGANGGGTSFQVCPTSYDYDAPVSEAGDLTDKYFAIRDVVGKYLPLTATAAPTNSTKAAYGDVQLEESGALFDLAKTLPSVSNEVPLTFEELKLSNGIVIYETVLSGLTSDPAMLTFSAVNDRGYLYLDEKWVGLLAREQQAFSVPIFAKSGQKLSVVVESQGRICYGDDINDFKGIVGKVTLGGNVLLNWTHTAVDVAHLPVLQPSLQLLPNAITATTMVDGELSFYNGTFTVTGDPADTFLRLDGWNKGIAYINDFCIGRYWPVMGPQVTLYVPHGLLNTGDNTVTLLELEGAPCGNTASCKVTFTDKPVIDGPTP